MPSSPGAMECGTVSLKIIHCFCVCVLTTMLIGTISEAAVVPVRYLSNTSETDDIGFNQDSTYYVADDILCTPSNTKILPDDEAASNFLHSHVTVLVYALLLPLIVVLGLTGNCAFLFMVGRLSHMKTTVNFLLVNLAITDIIFLSTQATYLMYSFFSSDLTYRYPFETNGSCITIYLIGYVSHYCSVTLITLISVERFYAICHPFLHRKMQSRGHTLKALALAYSVSVVLAVATLLKRMNLVEFCLKWPDDEKYRNLPKTFRMCGPLGGIEEIMITMEILYFILFFAAAISNGFLYTKIILALNSRSVNRQNSATETHHVLVRNQVARALVINGILFFVTQAPMRVHDINVILEAFAKDGFFAPKQKANFLSFAAFFLFLNSALNPYVYAFGSSNYRQGFWEAFGLSRKFDRKFERGSLHSVSGTTETTRI